MAKNTSLDSRPEIGQSTNAIQARKFAPLATGVVQQPLWHQESWHYIVAGCGLYVCSLTNLFPQREPFIKNLM